MVRLGIYIHIYIYREREREKDIFDTAAVRKVRPNISKKEKEALKEIRSWNIQTVRV